MAVKEILNRFAGNGFHVFFCGTGTIRFVFKRLQKTVESRDDFSRSKPSDEVTMGQN
jgi:hypothetical protein